MPAAPDATVARLAAQFPADAELIAALAAYLDADAADDAAAVAVAAAKKARAAAEQALWAASGALERVVLATGLPSVDVLANGRIWRLSVNEGLCVDDVTPDPAPG